MLPLGLHMKDEREEGRKQHAYAPVIPLLVVDVDLPTCHVDALW